MTDWAPAFLGDLATFKAGNGFPKALRGQTRGDLPFAKVSDMNRAGNELSLSTAENYLSREQARELRAHIHTPGSTAFAKIGEALRANRRR